MSCRIGISTVAGVLLFGLTGLLIADEPRTWTDTTGRTMEAEFLRLKGDQVVFLKDGAEVSVPLLRLSANDRSAILRLAAGESVPNESNNSQKPATASSSSAGDDSEENKPITPQRRTWTDNRNQKVSAVFVRVHEDNVILNRGGRVLNVPYANLSEEDQQYVAEILESRGESDKIPEARSNRNQLAGAPGDPGAAAPGGYGGYTGGPGGPGGAGGYAPSGPPGFPGSMVPGGAGLPGFPGAPGTPDIGGYTGDPGAAGAPGGTPGFPGAFPGGTPGGYPGAPGAFPGGSPGAFPGSPGGIPGAGPSGYAGGPPGGYPGGAEIPGASPGGYDFDGGDGDFDSSDLTSGAPGGDYPGVGPGGFPRGFQPPSPGGPQMGPGHMGGMAGFDLPDTPTMEFIYECSECKAQFTEAESQGKTHCPKCGIAWINAGGKPGTTGNNHTQSTSYRLSARGTVRLIVGICALCGALFGGGFAFFRKN